MIDVHKIISDLIEEKRNNNVVPLNVSFVAVRNRVMEELNSELNAMYKDGKIKVYKTCNDKAIELIGK